MSRIDDIFDEVLRLSAQVKEGSGTKEKSYVVGSFLGIEVPIILFIMALFSLVNLGLAIALMGMALAVLLLVSNLPAGVKVRVESSDDFGSMALYVMVVLFALAILIAWSWSG